MNNEPTGRCDLHLALEERIKGLEATLDARIDGLEAIVREVRALMFGLVSTGLIALFGWLLKGCGP